MTNPHEERERAVSEFWKIKPCLLQQHKLWPPCRHHVKVEVEPHLAPIPPPQASPLLHSPPISSSSSSVTLLPNEPQPPSMPSSAFPPSWSGRIARIYLPFYFTYYYYRLIFHIYHLLIFCFFHYKFTIHISATINTI